ncbi:MAG: segregation/condensation protein A [Ruminococcaceae bacterium]|nr:segregation/condensation protein A [Oscillospiraceae bacterium]
MEQLSFKLDAFEGPLDLLLMLIKKNKVSIYDIPIATILDQYLEVMKSMEEMDLEVSSEFLVLAATLLQIKSRMLLPKDEDEEEEDPRTELVRRLLEYQQIKESIEFFREHENYSVGLFFKLPDAIERPPAEMNYSKMTLENLLDAYKMSCIKLERKLPPPKRSFSGIVGHEKVSIKEKVRKIWNGLVSKGRMLFKDIFKGVKSKPEAVASFLAVLEMIKLNKILVEDTGVRGEYSVTKITDDDNFNFEEIED